MHGRDRWVEPFIILEGLLRVARVATMRAAAAGCKLM
jgi:hypothetical protein